MTKPGSLHSASTWPAFRRVPVVSKGTRPQARLASSRTTSSGHCRTRQASRTAGLRHPTGRLKGGGQSKPLLMRSLKPKPLSGRLFRSKWPQLQCRKTSRQQSPSFHRPHQTILHRRHPNCRHPKVLHKNAAATGDITVAGQSAKRYRQANGGQSCASTLFIRFRFRLQIIWLNAPNCTKTMLITLMGWASRRCWW